MQLASPPALALAHLTVLEVPPLELVGLAARSGYRSIGLRLHPAYAGSPYYEIPAGSTVSRQMQQRLRDEGITVNDIEFIGIGEHFEARQLQKLIDAAGALGARQLNVCGDDPDFSRLSANFASLCELAAPHGLRVELEYMAWRQVKRFDDALQVVTRAGQPNGGVLIDVLHLVRTGGSLQDLQRAPEGLLRSVQLCDAAAQVPTTPEALLQEARTGRLPPGEGALPLREFVAALPEGTALALEVPSAHSTNPEDHARRVFQATQAVLAARPASG